MRRAKIVCTLGPATDSKETILNLVQSGMDVARINASHGSQEEHAAEVAAVRRAAELTGKPVAVLVDLQGPKIRLGVFPSGPVVLKEGAPFTITIRDVQGSETIASTTYEGLPGDCEAGDILLIDDGRITLRVVETTDTDVITTVVVGGTVSDHKGINLPGVAVSAPALTDKDAQDLEWALKAGADYIALSFVRSERDVDPVHEVMDRVGVHIPVIAKIEKPQAVQMLESVIDAFDGVMVARGDLGVEMPLEQVPLVQKRAITLCRNKAKPVIVATQVLDSMITNPRPTRAEASDCANAILDGADAVMLSAETSVGMYPVETVETMASIIEYTEDHALDHIPSLTNPRQDRTEIITHAAMDIAEDLTAKYVAVFSASGLTARYMARLRAPIPMLVLTMNPQTRNQLALLWGARTYVVPEVNDTDHLIYSVDHLLRERMIASDGDYIVIVAGMPVKATGSTNTIRTHKMGDAINKY
ncbi:MAG: pyruvate kinase [Actinomycetaceae bacterium]|nr:pyruvate kinase [Actinomycetaceae bacterium]MDY6083212.1 pyruvate kinase [Actinomycetaceae bacterium]